MLLGAVADDLTGATDLALMISRQGMKTVQAIGALPRDIDFGGAEAVAVALKSRTIAAADAQHRDARCGVGAEVGNFGAPDFFLKAGRN
jgi:uncharacterized protein YgbK (DUF1537 family)